RSGGRIPWAVGASSWPCRLTSITRVWPSLHVQVPPSGWASVRPGEGLVYEMGLSYNFSHDDQATSTRPPDSRWALRRLIGELGDRRPGWGAGAPQPSTEGRATR